MVVVAGGIRTCLSDCTFCAHSKYAVVLGSCLLVQHRTVSEFELLGGMVLFVIAATGIGIIALASTMTSIALLGSSSNHSHRFI